MADSQQPDTPTLEQAIGRVLKALRLKAKLKQIEVAVATNFGVRSIRTMEYGKQSMTIRSLDALAMFYKVPLEDIIIQAKQLRGE